MANPTIRPQFAAILVKIETTEGTDASPTGALDAIPVEQDSITFTNPYKMVDTNEATGTLVDSAPIAVGQPATITFKSRLKGAGAGTVYTSTVKPPHFAVLAGCGKRGYFQAAITASVATAGTTTSATLGTGFATTAQAYRGMPAVIGAGTNNGSTPMIVDYSGSSKVATFTDLFTTACDVTSSFSIPANWTFAGTSPKDPANRLTDQPSVTIYFYKDGLLYKFVGCRGQVDFDATTNNNGLFTFSYTGVFAGQSDSPIPTLNYASQSAPLFLQQQGSDLAFAANRKALPVSKVAIKESATVESPDDPNTAYGFAPAVITQRSPSLTIDPLMTLTATRNTLNEIASATNYSSVMRFGQTNGNRAAITMPVVQPVQSNPGTRGSLATEDWMAKILASATQDAQNRDSDWIICYW